MTMLGPLGEGADVIEKESGGAAELDDGTESC